MLPTAALCASALSSRLLDVGEPTSLLELQPSVEWDRAQHSLMEADEPFYIQRATGVRGDVKVADDLYCGALTNPDGDIFCSGDLCNDGHVIADRLEASLCQADSVDVDALVTGPNTLTVDSLRVSGALSGVSNTSCDEVEVGGTRQWAGVFLQTFDDVADATSWHGGRASECDGDGVLAGGCGGGGASTSGSGGGGGAEASRVVEGLPPHTGLQLRASFLFVDAWRGEHAYAKVDGAHVWLDHYDARAGSGGVDVCGGPTPERRMRIPVTATVPHNASSVNISFGSTLQPAAGGAGCDASWAVDNVEVHTR